MTMLPAADVGEVDQRGAKPEDLPPVAPLVAGLMLATFVVHIWGPYVIAPEEVWRYIVMDAVLVLICGGVGWGLRRSLRATTRGGRFEGWEKTFGTGGPSVICAGLSLLFTYVAIRYDRTWAGLAVLSLLVSVYAAAIARRHPMLKPGEVILSGEQPEDIENYERREFDVRVPSLASVSEMKKTGIWIKKENLAVAQRSNRSPEWDGDVPRFDRYVEESWEVTELADRLTEVAHSANLDVLGEAKLAMDLIQALPFSSDLESKGKQDYWRYPVETLAEGTGDSEDFAILAVALLSAMGHRTCFFDVPADARHSGHVAMGVAVPPSRELETFEVADGAHFAYIETTTQEFRLGQLPRGITREMVRIGKIIAPLKGRVKSSDLEVVGVEEWRLDGRALLVGSCLLAAFGASLGAVLHYVSP